VQYRVELETLLTSTLAVLSESFFEKSAFQCHCKSKLIIKSSTKDYWTSTMKTYLTPSPAS